MPNLFMALPLVSNMVIPNAWKLIFILYFIPEYFSCACVNFFLITIFLEYQVYSPTGTKIKICRASFSRITEKHNFKEKRLMRLE